MIHPSNWAINLKHLNTLRAILMALLAWAIAAFICIALALILGLGKMNPAQLLSPILIVALCRWVWNGSPFSRYIAIGMSLLGILGFGALVLSSEKTMVFPIVVGIVSLVVWLWFGGGLIFSKQISSERDAHWRQLKTENQTPSYMPVLRPGIILGVLFSLMLIGGFQLERYFKYYKITQNWLDQVAAEVNKKAPSQISEFITFTGVKSGNFSLRYEYTIKGLSQTNSIDDTKERLIGEAQQTDCRNSFIKQLTDEGVEVIRNYYDQDADMTYELSLNTLCGPRSSP